MANGQAYTSPTGSIRHTTRPAPHRFRPASAPAPSPDRWKKESPVSTRSPFAHQPVVELDLLVGGRVQVVPHIGAPAGRAAAG